jgi:hypothetical protein
VEIGHEVHSRRRDVLASEVSDEVEESVIRGEELLMVHGVSGDHRSILDTIWSQMDPQKSET